jgi:hypothetical protein
LVENAIAPLPWYARRGEGAIEAVSEGSVAAVSGGFLDIRVISSGLSVEPPAAERQSRGESF